MIRVLLTLLALLELASPSRAATVIACQDATGADWVASPDHPCSTSSVATPLAAIASTALEASHVLKASAGSLSTLSVTTSSAAGYLLLFNATTAPADGAVTPAACFGSIPAGVTFSLAWPSASLSFSTGITAVFSTTGCLTKTSSATAYFSGQVQ